MAVKYLTLGAKETATIPLEEISQQVTGIISTLGKSYRDFQHASEMYNSDFFRDELPEFKQQLCKALLSYFSPNQNSFWRKAAAGAQEESN